MVFMLITLAKRENLNIHSNWKLNFLGDKRILWKEEVDVSPHLCSGQAIVMHIRLGDEVTM